MRGPEYRVRSMYAGAGAGAGAFVGVFLNGVTNGFAGEEPSLRGVRPREIRRGDSAGRFGVTRAGDGRCLLYTSPSPRD